MSRMPQVLPPPRKFKFSLLSLCLCVCWQDCSKLPFVKLYGMVRHDPVMTRQVHWGQSRFLSSNNSVQNVWKIKCSFLSSRTKYFQIWYGVGLLRLDRCQSSDESDDHNEIDYKSLKMKFWRIELECILKACLGGLRSHVILVNIDCRLVSH